MNFQKNYEYTFVDFGCTDGTLSTSDPVSISDIPGEYMYIEKVN